MRTVILHYHLFKNAGTSFDGILRHNFPGAWVCREFDRPRNADQVAEWIAATPDAVAFSSHTANGPLPRLPGIRVISALFLRDPVARIRSAYLFERRQAETSRAEQRGVALAQQHDLAGYVAARLAVPGDRQCRNFHCARLATFAPTLLGGELARALAALNLVTFVGLVEAFPAAMLRFQAIARQHWPHFHVPPLHLNRSQSVEEAPVGPDLAALLESRNTLDRVLISQAEALPLRDMAGHG